MGGSGGAGVRLTECACAGACWCVDAAHRRVVRVVQLRLAGPYEGGYRGRSGNMFASSTPVDSALARRRPVASGGGGELGSSREWEGVGFARWLASQAASRGTDGPPTPSARDGDQAQDQAQDQDDDQDEEGSRRSGK
jgi:hypothetical protein